MVMTCGMRNSVWLVTSTQTGVMRKRGDLHKHATALLITGSSPAASLALAVDQQHTPLHMPVDAFAAKSMLLGQKAAAAAAAAAGLV